jgi:hypothetical protein
VLRGAGQGANFHEKFPALVQFHVTRSGNLSTGNVKYAAR